VVVDNQPAAGGLAALNRIYAGEPDGLQIIIMNGGAAVMSQLFDLPTVQYDLARVGYLATASSSPWLALVHPDSPLKNLADLAKSREPVRWPATGPIDGLSDGATMVCEALAIPCRVVMGYKSSNEGALAVQRKEMDALYVSDTSANAYVKAGTNRAIAVVSKTRSRFFPDAPTVFEGGGLTTEQAWWFSARADTDALGRILLAGPNLPPARLAYLQAAVRRVLTDPAVLAEGEKYERYVEFQSPEATRDRALGLIANIRGEQKERMKNVALKKYFPGG
jgi:tripartite-type tricarboxylate transporter receptor subunit TctC